MFSVLMSVYAKENSLYLKDCFESLLGQSLRASEIILVEDGPISNELRLIIDCYVNLLPFKNIRLPENKGLANALNEGLKHCNYELVARMDTDDVALPHRFARQVKFMQDNPDISVASAWVEERDNEMAAVGFLKVIPENYCEILTFAKRRNPINHPVAIFRKSAVLAVGGYPLIFPEDYALWSLMLVKGYQFYNIQEVLLYMRTGDAFIDRRGLSFFKGEIGLLKFQKAIGFLSGVEFCLNFMLRAAIRLPPAGIRKFLYKNMR